MFKLLDEVKIIKSKGYDDGYLNENGIIVSIKKYDELEYTIVGFCKRRYTVCDYENSFWACAGWKKDNLIRIKSNTPSDILEKSKTSTLYAKSLYWLTTNYRHIWNRLNEKKVIDSNSCKIIRLDDYR